MNRGRIGFAVLALAGGIAHAAPLGTVVTDKTGGPVPEAVVWAIPVTGKAVTGAPRPAIIDQINKEFVPFVVPVQLGAPVTFPNKDNIRHHVYSFSPAKIFDLKLYSGVPSKPVVFDKPGPVALGCNIHDWMVGYVYVVESAWFAKTGKTGTATLEMPDGDYDLKVWHPWQRAEVPALRVKVMPGTSPVGFVLDLSPPPRALPR